MSKDASSLLEWFGKRKEDVVGGGLRTMSLSVLDCVTELGLALRAMAEEDPKTARKAILRLNQCEHEADSQEDDLCNQISIGELSAQEREDLMRFIRKADKIANWSKEAAIGISIIDDTGMVVPRQIWEMLAKAVADLESEVRGLANAINMMGTEGSDIMECVRGIREMERALDQIYYDLIKAILQADMDPKAVVMLTRVVDAIENAADTCKVCSDTVAILHYAKRV